MFDDGTKPRRKRIVLCMGEFCNMGRRASKLYKQLEPAIAGKPCIKLETARCLNLCGAGPNLVIYPDNVVYHALDDAALADVIRDHITPCGE